MPWINKESCTGCGICVEECPAGAIGMENDIAFIKDDACIRCGICHDVCPEDAARHDGERIPEEVQLISCSFTLDDLSYNKDLKVTYIGVGGAGFEQMPCRIKIGV